MSDTIEDCLRMCRAAYPEYASIDPDTFSELMAELATLRANQLSPAIVAAVRAYQEAFLEHRKASVLVLGGTRDVSIAWDNLQTAIEADAKERG